MLSSMNSPSPSAMSSSQGQATSCDSIWQEALKKASKRLSAKEISKIQDVSSYESFAKDMQAMVKSQERNSKSTKALLKLEPALSHLRSFADAIAALTQYQGTPATLVWGTLLFAIDISLRFVQTLEIIVEMFVEITSAMPRFDLYTKLFSTEVNLRKVVTSIYEKYINFTIDTIFFIKQKPLRQLISFAWKPMKKKFESTRGDIRHISNEVENWAAAASYTVQDKRNKEAVERHQEIVRMFPNIKITTKVETRALDVQRNPRFYGRNDVLETIYQSLKPRAVGQSKAGMKSLTLHGFGGIGKTQTATEFVYRYMNDYSAIFWFHAETTAILRQDLADAARKVGIVPDSQMPDLAVCIEMFNLWLYETDQDWLIILDNVDCWADIVDVWPTSQHGSILITTRDAEIGLYTTTKLHLNPYNEADGVGFLRYLLKDTDEETLASADDLAKEIDGYPLALSHAAGYILTHHVTCAQFMDFFRDLQLMRHVNKSSPSISSLPSYSLTIEDVWTLSLKKLPGDTMQILNITAFLDPDNIEQEIIEKLPSLVKKASDVSTKSNPQHQIATILRALTQHTLLMRTRTTRSKTFTIHRLLQRDLLARLQDNDPDDFQLCFQNATDLIRHQFPAQHVAEPLTPFWNKCQQFLPHVMRLLAVFADTRTLDKSEMFASLLGDAGYYQWERGLLKDALDLCYNARDIIDEVTDETSVHKADILNVIGAIYIESGAAHIHEGTEIMERVLRIRQKRLDLRKETDDDFEEDYICVSNALSNLSCCWIGLQKWDKGFESVNRAIEMFKRFCSEESNPYGFAERYANMGQVLAGQGDLTQGIEFVKRATELQRKAFGSTDVRSCVFESYWGNFLIMAGKVDEAYERHQTALEIRKTKLGSASNDVAKSLYFVAYCHFLKERYSEADKMLMEALDIYKRMYWTENRIARAQFLRSLVYEKMGDHVESTKLRVEAGRLRQELTGIIPKDDDVLSQYEELVFYH